MKPRALAEEVICELYAKDILKVYDDESTVMFAGKLIMESPKIEAKRQQMLKFMKEAKATSSSSSSLSNEERMKSVEGGMRKNRPMTAGVERMGVRNGRRVVASAMKEGNNNSQISGCELLNRVMSP